MTFNTILEAWLYCRQHNIEWQYDKLVKTGFRSYSYPLES